MHCTCFFKEKKKEKQNIISQEQRFETEWYTDLDDVMIEFEKGFECFRKKTSELQFLSPDKYKYLDSNDLSSETESFKSHVSTMLPDLAIAAPLNSSKYYYYP